MKKTYSMPVCKSVNMQVRTIIAASPDSLVGDTMNNDANDATNAENNLGHSIWNDETSDGFNW